MNRAWWWPCALLVAATVGCSGHGGGDSSRDGGLDRSGDGSQKSTDAETDGDAGPRDTEPPTFAGATSATALSETQIAVTWDPATDNHTPQGSIVYRVYIGLKAGGETFASPVITSPAGATGATIAALHAWTDYFIVVRALDEAGNEDSNHVEVTAKTKDTTPPVFAGAKTVTGTSASTALVSWNPATDNGSAREDIHYEVYASETEGGENYKVPSVVTIPGATSVSIIGLAEAKSVFVVVRAVDAAGNKDSNRHEVQGVTLDQTPPTFAGVVSAKSVGTSITLTWAAGTDNVTAPAFLTYDVYMATSPEGENFTKASFSSLQGATSFSVIKLSVSTQYYFVVRARDLAGNEDKNTVEASATTAASPDTTPPVFAGVATVTAISDKSLDVSWPAATDDYTPQNQILYDIFIASVSGGEYYATPSYTSLPGATSFTITGLAPQTTEYVVVRARDEAGNEDANTVEKHATSLQDTIPPTFAGISSVVPVSDTSLQLSWTLATDDVSPSSAIAYRVYQASSQGAENFNTPTATVVAGQSGLLVQNLLPGSVYWFVVHAVDAAGNEDHNSVEMSGAPLPDKTPPAFNGVTGLTSTSPTTLTATWNPATDDVTPSRQIVYLPFISTAPGGEPLTVLPTPTAQGATTYTFTGLAPSTPYYVIVRAEDAAGNVDSNTTELIGPTQDDVTPPIFAGAGSVGSTTDQSLVLTWNAASDNVTPASLITYLVCMTTTPGGCSGTSFTPTVSIVGALSKSFTGLVPNTTYYFEVRAEDQAQNIDSNNIQVTGATTPDTTPPTFGGLVSASSSSPTTINLSWNAGSDDITPADQLVYDIFQASASNGEAYGGPTYSTTAGQTTYTVTGLLPKETLFFVVRARDQAGNHDLNTVERSAQVEQDQTPPSFGGITTLTATGLTSLHAAWNTATSIVPPNSAIFYDVCWATTNLCTNTFTAMASTPAGQLFYDLTGLTDNTPYTVVVRAHDPYGNTDSNVIFITTSTQPDTTPPTFSGPPSVTASTDTTLTVSWPLATDNYSPQSSLRYLICKTTTLNACNGAAFTPTVSLPSQSSFQFTGLSNGVTYYFVVRAEDQANNIDGNNNQISGKPANDVTPPVFAGLTSATGQSDSTIQLSWTIATDDVSTATQITYDIYQGATSGAEPAPTSPTYTVTGTAGPTQQYTVTNLLPSRTYYFIVYAVDSAGNRQLVPSVEKSGTTAADHTLPVFGTLLGVAVTSDTQLTPSWTAGTDDTTPSASLVYEVCWSTTASCTTSFVAMATTPAGALSYTPAPGTLTPNTLWNFVVRVEDASGNVDTNVQTAHATTLADNPPAFAGVAGVSAITFDSATVSWPVATDDYTTAATMRYSVCLTTSSNGCSGGAFVAVTGTPVTGVLSFGLTGLIPATNYWVVVRAENLASLFNTTNQNNQTPFATIQDPHPPGFGGLTSATQTGPTSIQLSWTAATDDYTPPAQITYDIYGGGASGTENLSGTPLATDTGVTGAINFTVAASPGATACYIVRAKNLAGISDSNAIEHCATTPETAPAFTTQPFITGTTTSSSMSLAWAAASNPAGFAISYQLCSSTTNGQCTTYPGTGSWNVASSPTMLSGLSSNTTYYFVVRATDSTGSTLSNQVSGTTSVQLPSVSITCSPNDDWPTYLQTTVSATVGTYPIASYRWCWSTPSATCASSFQNLFSTTVPTGWIGANNPVGGNGGGGTYGPALAPNTNYFVNAIAVDTNGNQSPVSASANCTTPISFATNILPILDGATDSCGGCHGAGSPFTGAFNQAFFDAQPALTSASGENTCNTLVSSGYKFIVANNTTLSVIYRKMDNNAPCGGTMPFGSTTVDPNAALIGAWINQGAFPDQ